MKYFLLASLLLWLVATLLPLKAEKPNILFLLMDDLGYGDLGCYNPESKIPTPHLDRLAKEGMRFTDAHSPSGVCSPTRYAVLTGRYCWRTHLKKGVLKGDSPPLIEEERMTVGDLLLAHGYQTAHVGKWHLGHTWHLHDASKPVTVDNIDWSRPMISGVLHQGFEYSFGLGKPAWVFAENDKVLAEPNEAFDLGQDSTYFMGGNNYKGYRSPGYRHEQMLPRFTEAAVRYIRRAAQSEKPFFLYYAPIAPHKPVVPNPEFVGKSGAGIYGDFVAEMDFRIGQILQALEETGEAEETLVIFTSDNGPENIAYDRIRDFGHYSMQDWRGVKRDLWEGGNRVPFIVRWPGKVKAASINGEVVSLVDFMATAAALVNRKLPEHAAEDSYNLLPTLLGMEYPRPLREATVYSGSNGVLAIRRNDWVFIDAGTGMVSREPEWFRQDRGVEEHDEACELFDLARDPQQRENRAARHPEVAAQLKTLLDRYVSSGRSRPN